MRYGISLVSVLGLLLVLVVGCKPASEQFAISDSGGTVSIVYDSDSSTLSSKVANLLARDIEAVTGRKPGVYTSIEEVSGNAIVLGDASSGLIRRYVDTSALKGEWERYGYIFKANLAEGVNQAMFIVGSDPRGMAYGVFDLSMKIGVSPWYWWADVPAEKRSALYIRNRDIFSDSPSVKYRGIFLNDEGWGLEPWASKTFEPSVGNIGPETYAKVFELMLRLKANMIWPAMHPNTAPFFQVPGNAEAAREWEIVVGTSHAEPMLRNNVGEWDHDQRGPFNYKDNASSVYEYWERRVRESGNVNAIYTVGMRGVHDSGMEGGDSTEEKVALLEQVISDQRDLLGEYINDDVSSVPQSFTPYKEVLDIYESGLDLPEDITIVWPDDNHGYIRRFSSAAEQQRYGGAGVYYHLSYLGSPHPYIWLSPTTPSLVWREMTRAWQQNMNQVWVANVGDLKRREWETELFMDLAWNIHSWTPDNLQSFFEMVVSRDISKQYAKEISGMMWEYYRLASERKPEFMGFNESQWAGYPPVRDPLYSLWNYGDEVEQRIDNYRDLRVRAEAIWAELPKDVSDTFFQLVYYPIAGAAAMNEKWLYAYKSREYAKQGRTSANRMSDMAFSAFDQIRELTRYYNQEVAGGKWEHIADYRPGYQNGSTVFFEPITTPIETREVGGLGVSIEGQGQPLSPIAGSLPAALTRGSTVMIKASEADLSGELVLENGSGGDFLTWAGSERGGIASDPLVWDSIPYVVDGPTKAVFEFYYEGGPGGRHTLNLLVDSRRQEGGSWWVTVNDHKSIKVDHSESRGATLAVGEYVLVPRLNTLTIHPNRQGAKLYGVEFVREAREIMPEFARENRLPAFNRYTREARFIDLFNRGQKPEKWSANTSSPWIALSRSEGVLNNGSERIWVTVDYSEAPAGRDVKGYVEITNGEQRYRVDISVFNQELDVPSGAFVEANGVISVPAHQYSGQKAGRAASWRPITGLGRSGSAMLLEPMQGWYVEELPQVRQNSPALEYDVVVIEGGAAELVVEAVPAFPLQPSRQMRCAVSVNDEPPRWVIFEMGEPGSQPWQDNVLQSRMVGTAELELEPGVYHFKLWGTDPAINVDRITFDFGGLVPSYVGPLPTKAIREE